MKTFAAANNATIQHRVTTDHTALGPDYKQRADHTSTTSSAAECRPHRTSGLTTSGQIHQCGEA